MYFSDWLIFSPTSAIFYLRVVLGVVAFFWIPGYYIVQAFFQSSSSGVKIGYSLIFGLMAQILFVYSFWSIGLRQINFRFAITTMTVCFVLMTKVLGELRKKDSTVEEHILSDIREPSTDKILLIVFFLALIFRVYFQSFSLYPSSDGSLYLEAARNLVEGGEFSSSVVLGYSPLFFKLGFVPHPTVYFLTSVFFLFGDVSYFSAKLMTVLAGALLVFPVYGIAKELYDKKTGFVAAAFAATQPLLVLFSSMLYGPEILGTLFAVTTFYFFLRGLRNKGLICMVFGGLFAGLTFHSWPATFYTLLGSLMVLVALNYLKIRRTLYAFSLMVGLVAAIQLAARPAEFWLLLAGLTALLIFIVIKKRGGPDILKISLFVATTWLFIYFGLIRQYIHIDAIVVTQNQPVQYWFVERYISTFRLEWGNFVSWWDYIINNWAGLTPLLATLSFLSIFNVSKWRENLSIFSYPFLFSLLFTFLIGTQYEPMNPRLSVSTFPFFVILAAPVLVPLVNGLFGIARPKRTGVKWSFSVTSVLMLILLAPTLGIFFSQSYAGDIGFMESMNRRIYWYDPNGDEYVFKWIRENIPEDAKLMARAPYEWAWFTSRTYVVASPYYIGETEFLGFISQHAIDYLIVDSEFNQTYTSLKELGLYLPSRLAPSASARVNNSSSAAFWSLSARNDSVEIDTSDQQKGPTLRWDIDLAVEGPSSTHHDLIYNPPGSWDWSSNEFLVVWIYGDGRDHDFWILLDSDSMGIDGRYFEYVMDWTGWKRIVISLDNSHYMSSGLNMTVDRIIFRYDSGLPISNVTTVRISDIYIDGSVYPPQFKLVFLTLHPQNGLKVLIYDVRDVWKGVAPPRD